MRINVAGGVAEEDMRIKVAGGVAEQDMRINVVGGVTEEGKWGIMAEDVIEQAGQVDYRGPRR